MAVILQLDLQNDSHLYIGNPMEVISFSFVIQAVRSGAISAVWHCR